MPFDIRSAELIAEQAVRKFADGLQGLIAAAASEAELEWQRIDDESHALAMDRRRLEEAWAQLHNAEASRLEVATGMAASAASTATMGVLSPAAVPRSQWVPLPQQLPPQPPSQQALQSPSQGPYGVVPSSCTVTVGRFGYSVLPLQEPSAPNLGHDLWNHTIDLPDGWEVVSSGGAALDGAVAALTQHGWGAMVLGVRNASQGFDAYWTPLFGDGTRAGQLCEADVDWIEPISDDGRRFRMNYSGLRLAIRTQNPIVQAAPTFQGPMIQPQLLSYNGGGARSPLSPSLQTQHLTKAGTVLMQPVRAVGMGSTVLMSAK